MNQPWVEWNGKGMMAWGSPGMRLQRVVLLEFEYQAIRAAIPKWRGWTREQHAIMTIYHFVSGLGLEQMKFENHALNSVVMKNVKLMSAAFKKAIEETEKEKAGP